MSDFLLHLYAFEPKEKAEQDAFLRNMEEYLCRDDASFHIQDYTLRSFIEKARKQQMKKSVFAPYFALRNDYISQNAAEETTTNTLDVTSFLETLVAPASTGATSKYLSVEKISQPGETNICWAIAITSIANFIWDGSWTYSNIVQMFSGGADRTMSTEEVVYNFNYYFEADWWYSYTTTLAPNTILNYLLANYPLYGDFTRSGGAHAVVIRGVSTTLNTFSVMNPTPSTTSYTSGTISSNNTLTFVSGYSGSTYTLRSYIYPVLP